jgi:hypothetical protein
MKFSITWAFIALSICTSCVNKTIDSAEILDPNELVKTRVESTDSLELKGIGNFKAFEMLTADLDGDKINENITLRVSPDFLKAESDDPNGIVETTALICIKNQFIRTNLHLNANYENGKAFLMEIKDINKADKYKEIVFTPYIHGEDPPGDYQIIRFINGELSHFKIPGDGEVNDYLRFQGDGTFSIDYTIGSEKGIDPVTGKYKANDIKKIFMLSKKGIIFKDRDTSQTYIKEFAG